MPRPAPSLLSVQLAADTDFLLARQRARQIAELLGFEKQDQTRIATAVSEIARNAFEYAGGGRAAFFLDRAPIPQFRIVISDRGPGIPNLEEIWSGAYHSPTGMGLGLTGARRLLDGLHLESSSSGTTATLLKHLPASAPDLPSHAHLTSILVLAGHNSTRALTDQSHELLTLLDELRTRETELQRLNLELEETNRGVLVLYAELEDRAHAVQRASEMKTRFLSGVTHELRTPLNSIVSLSRLLLQRVDGDLNPEQQKQVQFILRSAQTLSEMVNDLLDLARIEAGKTSITLTTFSVAEILATLRGMFRPLALHDQVELIFHIPHDPIHLHTDEGKLSQILRNFISNALKFTTTGSITVRVDPAPAEQPPGSILFAVADTGIGIAPEHFSTVMEEWGQVEAPGGKQRGSGLGLPLSRSLAELLGGQVWFTSTLGAGSTFYLLLHALLPSDPPPEPRLAATAGPDHILLAGEDEVARYRLRHRLSNLTTTPVLEVSSGLDCLSAVEANPPRILFLDLLMPGLSGLEVARQLRAHTPTRDLPIVLSTVIALSAEELAAVHALQLTLLVRQPPGQDPARSDQQHAEIERALLEVGLSNMHQAPELP